jgi:pSer/pThr/pTyr-binding forkhead associated (FHA) protein
VWRTPEGACWIEDLGSTNGTRVDGQRVEKAWLRPGSSVALGDETLQVS